MVGFPEQPIRVQGRVVAWTNRAVWVEFTMRNGATLRAWVWASAVDRKGTESSRPLAHSDVPEGSTIATKKP